MQKDVVLIAPENNRLKSDTRYRTLQDPHEHGAATFSFAKQEVLKGIVQMLLNLKYPTISFRKTQSNLASYYWFSGRRDLTRVLM